MHFINLLEGVTSLYYIARFNNFFASSLSILAANLLFMFLTYKSILFSSLSKSDKILTLFSNILLGNMFNYITSDSFFMLL